MKKGLEAVDANLLRDQNNYRVLLEDYEGGIPLVFVPDCSDLIEFIHIEDPREEQKTHAYREAIRRYFVESNQLILVPSWTYEFLAYIHRIVIGNIHSHTSSDGLARFFKRHPNARRFHQLWSEKRFGEAERLYDVRKKWVQILAFTQDENVVNMLGKPLQRYNHLISSNKLVPLTDVSGSTHIERDGEVFERMLEHINQLRPETSDHHKNQVDADSCATVAWLDGQDNTKKYTAVTMTSVARDAYYNASNDPDHAKLPFSHVRSPIAYMIHSQVTKVVADGVREAYLERGIELNEEIRQKIRELWGKGNEYRMTPSEAVSTQAVAAYQERAALGSLLEEYEHFFRRPIIKPVLAYGSTPRSPVTLTVQQAGEILDCGKFETRMKEATQALKEQAREMVDLSHNFISKGDERRIGQKSLSELVRRIEQDFRKHIY